MAEQGRTGTAGRGAPWLAVEFAALYLGVPLLLALAAPADWLWPALLGLTAVALLLLAADARGSPGASWRAGGGASTGRWSRRWRRRRRRPSALLVWWLVPGQALWLPRRATGLWLAILALYPLLSALPQELIFRLLFFRRYAAAVRQRAGGGGGERARVRARAPDVLELGGAAS